MNRRNLLSSKGPWARLLVCTEAEADDLALTANQHSSQFAWIIRGQRCETKRTLLREWGSALQFPSYFGENWDAFEDCVNDLDWLPGKSRAIIITNTDRVLRGSRKEWQTFVAILRSSLHSRTVRRSDPHWHYVFHTDPAHEAITRKRLHGAGVAL